MSTENNLESLNKNSIKKIFHILISKSGKEKCVKEYFIPENII